MSEVKGNGPVCWGCVLTLGGNPGGVDGVDGVNCSGLYVNALRLIPSPFNPLTIIGFCCWTGVLLNGTTTLILNLLIIVILFVVVTLLIVTAVTWSKLSPTIVKIVPLIPVNGENVFIVGGGQVTVTLVVFKLFGELVIPLFVFSIDFNWFLLVLFNFCATSTGSLTSGMDLNAVWNVSSNFLYWLKFLLKYSCETPVGTGHSQT